MVFTAQLESVSRAGDPSFFDLGVLYLNDTEPDWRVEKTLRVTVDPALNATQQRASILAQITADAQRYKTQSAIQTALSSIVGTPAATVTI